MQRSPFTLLKYKYSDENYFFWKNSFFVSISPILNEWNFAIVFRVIDWQAGFKPRDFFLFLEEESISEPFNGKFLLILHCEEIDFQSHLKNNFQTFFLFHRKNVHESLLKKIKIKIKCSLGFDTIVYNFFSVFNLQFQNNIADRLNILLKIIALLFNL